MRYDFEAASERPTGHRAPTARVHFSCPGRVVDLDAKSTDNGNVVV